MNDRHPTSPEEIEECLLSCIFLQPKLLDEINFDDTYFENKKLLNIY